MFTMVIRRKFYSTIRYRKFFHKINVTRVLLHGMLNTIFYSLHTIDTLLVFTQHSSVTHLIHNVLCSRKNLIPLKMDNLNVTARCIICPNKTTLNEYCR